MPAFPPSPDRFLQSCRAAVGQTLGVPLFVWAGLVGTPNQAAANTPTVSRVTPARVTLFSGVASKVPITITGAALDQIASVSAVDARGGVVSALTMVFTGHAGATRRSVEIRGTGRVPVGTYRLRITTSSGGGRTAQVIDLPPTLVQVEVGDGGGYSGHGFQVTALLTCSQCHDMLAANVPNQFAWNANVVVAADRSTYALPQGALGATIEQIVYGQRSARADGLMCTACHNPPTGEATVTLNQNTTKQTFCAYASLFVETESKPIGLRGFFNNWRTRSCP